MKSLSDAVQLSAPETHLGFIEYKASCGRSSPRKFKKLLDAVNTLSAGIAENEQEFSANNNADNRNAMATNNTANLLSISTMGPPSKLNPEPY